MSYEKGDKVQFISDKDGIQIGTIGTVERDDGPTLNVVTENHKSGWWIHSDSVIPFKGKLESPKFLVTWDESSHDPVAVFYDRKTAEKFLDELVTKESVNKNSIRMYAVSKTYKIKVSTEIAELV